MNKILGALALVAASTVAFAQMPSPEDIMKDNDANKDGKITKEEAAATPLGGFFDQMDTNKDGVITMEELKNMRPPG